MCVLSLRVPRDVVPLVIFQSPDWTKKSFFENFEQIVYFLNVKRPIFRFFQKKNYFWTFYNRAVKYMAGFLGGQTILPLFCFGFCFFEVTDCCSCGFGPRRVHHHVHPLGRHLDHRRRDRGYYCGCCRRGFGSKIRNLFRCNFLDFFSKFFWGFFFSKFFWGFFIVFFFKLFWFFFQKFFGFFSKNFLGIFFCFKIFLGIFFCWFFFKFFLVFFQNFFGFFSIIFWVFFQKFFGDFFCFKIFLGIFFVGFFSKIFWGFFLLVFFQKFFGDFFQIFYGNIWWRIFLFTLAAFIRAVFSSLTISITSSGIRRYLIVDPRT